MGSGGNIFTTLRDEPMHVKMAFTIGELRKNQVDTMWKGKPIGRDQFITSRPHLMEMGSMTERQARFAMARLRDLGLWKLDAEGKRFTRITVLSNVQEKVLEKVQANESKKQRELQNRVQENVQEKVHRVVDVVPALSHSPDVVVSPVLIQKVKGQDMRATPIVHKPRTTATARYEEAIARAPDLPSVVMHVDELYAEISEGKKYPWTANRFAATTLADLITSHGASLVMAATEKFFVNGNEWIRERAWCIEEFAAQFARLIAIPGITKRSAEIAVELKMQARPATPRRLRAQLDAMRRKAEAEFAASYDPSDVHLGEDLRRLRGKAAAGV